MAKKSSGSALGLLLLLAPVAWVCSVCGGDDRPPPAANPKPVESPELPVAAPMHDEPVVPVVDPEPEPEAHHAKHRRHGKREHHEEPTTNPSVAVDRPDSTADDIDRALQEALAEPSSKPERRPPSSDGDGPSLSTCCKHCGPSSQPCGDSCISLSKTCRKGRGCAC